FDEPTNPPVYADRLGNAPLTPDGYLVQNSGRITSANDLRLRFHGGDTWRDASGLIIARPNVTIDSYGVGNAYFSRFVQAYTGGWTNVGGDLWKRNEFTAIAWVRRAANPLGRMYALERSSATVQGYAY